MAGTGLGRFAKGIALAVAMALTSNAVGVPSAQGEISSAAVLTCNTAVNLFGATTSGSLFVYPHNEPETGNADWGQQLTNIGSGWNLGRMLAGPDGAMYFLDAGTGELRRLRWNGSGWDTWAGRQFRVVGTGWSRYSQAEHRNKVTVDEKGRLYEVDAEGRLKVYIWSGDHATGTWTPDSGAGMVLDSGWNQYNLIVAAGDGVLYARTPGGDLFRFRWHAASERFTQYRLNVGTGWWPFNRLFSPGGDILYGSWASNGGELVWYRYFEDTNTWANGTGKHVGSGWYAQSDVVADPNGCRLTGYPAPSRPTVAPRFDAPSTPVQGPDGLVTFFYVNSTGGLTAAKQRYAGDYGIIEYQVISDYHKFTGRPGAGIREDGRIDVLANSHDDAAFRGRTQALKNGSWGSTADVVAHQGWMAGDPVVVSEADKTLTIYAVDNAGALWRRAQIAPNGAYSSWRKVGNGGLTADFTAVRNGTALDIVARFGDGTLRTARHTGTTLGAWQVVGSDITGTPAAVAHLNGDLQVFARGTDGTIRTKRQSSGTFPATWQTLGGVAAAGSPAAVLRGGGLVELAVRGTDGFIHQSSQLAPAGSFGPWTVHYFEDSVTDPAGLLLANGSPIFTWRSADGTIRTAYIASTTNAVPAYAGRTAHR